MIRKVTRKPATEEVVIEFLFGRAGGGGGGGSIGGSIAAAAAPAATMDNIRLAASRAEHASSEMSEEF